MCAICRLHFVSHTYISYLLVRGNRDDGDIFVDFSTFSFVRSKMSKNADGAARQPRRAVHRVRGASQHAVHTAALDHYTIINRPKRRHYASLLVRVIT
jgi:hypothetical protein